MRKLLSKSNSKLKKDNIVSFGLPAGKTCPGARECKKYCYAQKGCFRFKSVVESREYNLEVSKKNCFVDMISEELRGMKKKPYAVRIHDSGDFYGQKYLDKWIDIAKSMPDILFYAYTKSNLDFSDRPSNLFIIQSMGGRFDHIDIGADTVAEVYDTYNQEKTRHLNCSESDKLAIYAAKFNLIIVLIKH